MVTVEVFACHGFGVRIFVFSVVGSPNRDDGSWSSLGCRSIFAEQIESQDEIVEFSLPPANKAPPISPPSLHCIMYFEPRRDPASFGSLQPRVLQTTLIITTPISSVPSRGETVSSVSRCTSFHACTYLRRFKLFDHQNWSRRSIKFL